MVVTPVLSLYKTFIETRSGYGLRMSVIANKPEAAIFAALVWSANNLPSSELPVYVYIVEEG